MKNAIFVFPGNCRTFMDCIDSALSQLIVMLFHNNVNIYIYFYLKLTDPGPKGQEGWNFQYNDVDSNMVLNKIEEIKTKYPMFNIEYKLIPGNEISDDELLSQVNDRSMYVNFLSSDQKLLRGLHCHYNFERCGKYILEKEASIQSQFDYIIYVRPDLEFFKPCYNITKYNPNIVTVGNAPNNYNGDHLAIIPRHHFNAFFFDRMNYYRNNTQTKIYVQEDVYFSTIQYEYNDIGTYVIKRP
jgi:hypothetical protein